MIKTRAMTIRSEDNIYSFKSSYFRKGETAAERSLFTFAIAFVRTQSIWWCIYGS